MANSSFKKKIRDISIPVTVPNGGTGRVSINDQAVIVGAGSGAVNFISPEVNGHVLKSDGTDWTSGVVEIDDGSVTYPKLDGDLVDKATLSTDNVDWSSASIFVKHLTSDTVLTFSNYQKNKMITLLIDGDYVLGLPIFVKVINGQYNGSVVNYINLHCVQSNTGSQEVWATIIQESTVSNYGYFAGGASSGTVYTTSTDRINFSTGVIAGNTVSNLSQIKMYLEGVSDTVMNGYFLGGASTGTTMLATADRIIFSTGATSANTVSNLSMAKGLFGSISDGNTYGYFAGGISSSVFRSTTDRIVFSTGATSANTVSDLSEAVGSLGSLSDTSVYGYFAGGETVANSGVVTTHRMTFSSEVVAVNTVSNLSQARYWTVGISDTVTYGYFLGGNTSGTARVATTDRIVFSTGATSANTVSNLSQNSGGGAGSADGSAYGYVAGGFSTTYSYLTDRIVFSTGITSANSSSNLSVTKFKLAGLSDCSV